MNVNKINQLEELLQLNNNEEIVDYQLTRLTAPGENYGSLMLSLDVTIKNYNNNQDQSSLALIAKLIPPNDFVQEIFNTQQTFKNEIAFYTKIVPLLNDFQLEQGSQKIFDSFPKFYGGRINLKPNSSKVDSDACLVLENLKLERYVNVDRTIGFDLETSKFILKNLAHFHGVTLGLKLVNPERFKLILPHTATFQCDEENLKHFVNNVLRIIEDYIPEVHVYLDRIRKGFDIPPFQPSRELFSTLVHSDFWVNNIMVKFGEDGKIAQAKFVDFQLCDYASAIKDMVFFIFSSVQTEVFKQHYDELIKYYYDSLVYYLRDVKCDTTQFTYEAFLDEINYEAKHSQFYHIMTMLTPIFAEKGVVKEISEITKEDFGNTGCCEVHKQKLIFVVNEYVKRNWI